MASVFLVFAFCLYRDLEAGLPGDFSCHMNLVTFNSNLIGTFNNCKMFGFSNILRLDGFIYTKTCFFVMQFYLTLHFVIFSAQDNSLLGISLFFKHSFPLT